MYVWLAEVAHHRKCRPGATAPMPLCPLLVRSNKHNKILTAPRQETSASRGSAHIVRPTWANRILRSQRNARWSPVCQSRCPVPCSWVLHRRTVVEMTWTPPSTPCRDEKALNLLRRPPQRRLGPRRQRSASVPAVDRAFGSAFRRTPVNNRLGL